MPELPEVETYKIYVETYSLDQEIDDVIIRDERVLSVSKKNFKKSIIGKSFISVKRHGKYLFIELNPVFLILHFGMSGDIAFFKNNKEVPKHSRILFKFINGNFLSYISQRMFGRVNLTENLDHFIDLKRLGPDAYTMNFNQFKKTIKKRTSVLKNALMNQQIIAGIGNIYSDEILFQAKIHPKTKINALNEKQLEILFKTIKKVLKVGIDKKGKLSTYPHEFLIPHRNKDETCPICDSYIQRYEISQRHGFFCPKCQKYLKDENVE